MAADDRMTLDFIVQFLDVLERHGYHHHDNLHTGKAVGLLRDVARIYEGTQDHPSGPSVNQAPSPQTAPEPPGPDSRDAVLVPVSELKTVRVALDIAADYMRDRAELCTDCPDQSCPACQSRLRDAQAYDQIAGQMLHAAQAARTAHASQPEPGSPGITPDQANPAAGKEAGQ